MELKADEMIFLRSDATTKSLVDVADMLSPGDGRMDMVEVEDLNILGII